MRIAGKAGMGALFSIVQIFANVYPILHLRWLRGRLDGLMRRMEGRSA